MVWKCASICGIDTTGATAITCGISFSCLMSRDVVLSGMKIVVVFLVGLYDSGFTEEFEVFAHLLFNGIATV